MANKWANNGNSERLYFGGDPKSLQIVTPAMKLKDACSLEEKLWLTSVQSVQSLSHVQLFATPWKAARQASLSITNSQSLLKLMSIELVMPSNHLILCHPLVFLPSIFPSIRIFSNESVLHIRWPKYWRCSFSISPSNEYSGLISFMMYWLDPFAVQGTLKSLSNTTVQNHQFFGTQFSLLSTLTSIRDYWKNHSFDCCCCW